MFYQSATNSPILQNQSGVSSVDFPSLEDCVANIDRAYLELGHRMGWRFLTGPRATFSPSTRIALITLNPGGNRDDSETHDQASSESGSAYYVESWNGRPAGEDKLQRQVQAMFSGIHQRLGLSGPTRGFVESDVLTAHFVPFRSPNFKELHARPASLRVAEQLWGSILVGWRPSLILHLSTDSYKAFCAIVRVQPDATVVEERNFATGWGNYKAEAMRFNWKGTARSTTIARLPHLSRFALFGRPQSRAYLEELLGYVTEGL